VGCEDILMSVLAKYNNNNNNNKLIKTLLKTIWKTLAKQTFGSQNY
jgi:hypothetical protein